MYSQKKNHTKIIFFLKKEMGNTNQNNKFQLENRIESLNEILR